MKAAAGAKGSTRRKAKGSAGRRTPEGHRSNPLVGKSVEQTVETVRAVIHFLQLADAGITSAFQIEDDIVMGRNAILDAVSDAVAALGENRHE